MKKQDYLAEFAFDIHIIGAANGLLIEFTEPGNNSVITSSRVVTSKEELLFIVKKQIEEFYLD
jgi:hypothetical protein